MWNLMKILIRKINILLVFLAIVCIEITSGVLYSKASLAISEEKNRKAQDIVIDAQNAQLTDDEQRTLDLINEYRRENGLGELKALSSLQNVAKLKAEDLVNNDYFSHTSDQLGTPFEMLRNNNVEYRIAGENLAGNINCERAVEAWINSPSHRDNILEDRFEYTGICAIDSPVYGRVYVQLFIGV